MLIAGFYISGTEPKTLLIRGVGPSLVPYGINDALIDPELRLFAADASAPIAANTGWATGTPADVVSADKKVGAFDLASDSADSALVVTLQPGLYSAHVRSASNATGIALVEIYEIR